MREGGVRGEGLKIRCLYLLLAIHHHQHVAMAGCSTSATTSFLGVTLVPSPVVLPLTLLSLLTTALWHCAKCVISYVVLSLTLKAGYASGNDVFKL